MTYLKKKVPVHFLLWILFNGMLVNKVALSETLENICTTNISCSDTDKPLWELGVAGIALNGPDYPGSRETNTKHLVIPYFIYRGEVIQAGEGGLVKAKAFENKRYKLDLSLDGAFNTDSDDNDARKDMEDLDYLFALGPQLTVNIDKNTQAQSKLDIRFQLRSVFSTDFSHLNQRGYVFETQFRYEKLNLFNQDIKLVTSVGPTWGTEKLMDYFYSVGADDALPDRRQYDASGGYMGTELNLGLVFKVMDARGRLFIGSQTTFLQGAQNKSSPLLNDETTFRLGIGFSYRLYESQKRVH